MTYAAEGNRATAQRMINAENNFIESLMTAADISRGDAVKVLAMYRKAKVVKMDAVGGRISVKHGAFWDADVIRKALAQACIRRGQAGAGRTDAERRHRGASFGWTTT